MTETNPHDAQAKREVAIVSPAGNRRLLEADELFAGEQEILIRNGDDIYRLRRTRLGKLILCK